ncbi:MAG: ISL3 family transposase [Bradymonadaceae bacterium]|nr:ISL3 family transposase [Lujinxingiaceae bacterium]MBA4159562.1 ISL3 family transposase [Gemmatimonadota bacterium]
MVRNFQFEATGLLVDVAPGWQIARCGECGTRCRAVHDARERRWRHHDLAGMTLYLRYRIRRADCPSCKTVKTEKVPWAANGANFTYDFEERVAFLAQQSSKTAVATLQRTAWRTVGMIIRRVVARSLETGGDRLDDLRFIGVDELSYRRHHEYVTVIVDHERSRIVWASKGKSAATLKRFFDDLGPERCEKLEAVTLDLSAAYIKAVSEATPEAKLIFDRFHVQRLAQDALDDTRRDEVREAVTKDQKKALKSMRWKLQKSAWNLTDADIQDLEELERVNYPIFRAHMLKESLVSILDGRQINVARRRLKNWIADARSSSLVHFARVAATIEKHLDGVLEYVSSRLSNGRTEGLNGKIRTITRRSFGFHSASALIAMIFLCCGGVHVTPAHSAPSGFH